MLIKSRMHPRNIYKNPPNFKELAIQFPEFRKYVKTDLSGKVTIDYQDQNAVKELTISLLKKDFDLEVTIDETRLIPRVPLSLNYILWIEDLLNSLQLETQPLGIDIGTGCASIYSLLAAKKGWKMLATEVDHENFKLAGKNISQNNLNSVISLKLVSNESELLIGVIGENSKYDFCMCNPPFFNYDEKPKNRTFKRKQLETVASKVPTEMLTEGGELAFILKLINESEKLRDQIKIYTTLVGKKTDFIYLKKEVLKVCPKSVAFTEFGQGRTIRWGLAWTFLEINLKDKSKPELEKNKKNKTKAPLQFVLPSKEAASLDSAFEELKQIFSQLKIEFMEESFNIGHALHFKASENNWSHQRRKKRFQARKNELEISQSCSTSTEEAEECSEPKKLKLDQVASNNVKSLIVEGGVTLRECNTSILLELSYMSGDKEALHQIFQYLKNYWSKQVKPEN